MSSEGHEWALMADNVTRADLDAMISHLSADDPRLTHGPAVARFEDAWSRWIGVRHTVMLNSGSSANDLSMLAVKYLRGPGEVILPPLGWVSDVASVLHAGHRPVFVDIELDTLAPSAESIAARIGPQTRCALVVHILGLNALTAAHLELFGAHDQVPLIEDVCESHGAMVGERLAGSVGWLSNFSFYYAHHLTTMEGGAVCTSDSEAYETVRMLRSHGLVREVRAPERRLALTHNHPDLNPDFIFEYAAHNMRPIELQGVLGLSQLERLNDNNKARRRNFELFLQALDGERFVTELSIEGQSNYAFIVILRHQDVQLRDRLETAMRHAGIEFRRGLSGGGNQLRQPYLKGVVDVDLADFPNVEHVHHYGWYVGNYPELPPERIPMLCDLLNSA